jgi:predicted DNA-binding transcriptional regulator AlpA
MNSPATNSTLSNPPATAEVENSLQSLVLWTTPEVAKFLHVSLKTVFNLRKKGLPYVQLGGAVRFVPQEIRDYLVNSRGLASHRARQIVRKGASR